MVAKDTYKSGITIYLLDKIYTFCEIICKLIG